MPRVPTYQPQVQEQALGMSQMTSVVSPELQNTGSRQQVEAGAALGNLAQAQVEIAARQKQRDDADAVFKAEADLRSSWIQTESDLRKTRRGDQAKGVTGDADKWWTDAGGKVLEKATTPAQKRLLGQAVERMRIQSLDSFRKFEDDQGELAHDTNWKAAKALTISQAAADPTLAPSAVAEIGRKNAYFAARRGLSSDVLDAMNLDDTTALHTEIIKQTVTKDPTAAKAYFEANKKQINGKSYDEITKLVDTASAANDGEKLADKVWTDQGPKSYNDPVVLDKMEEAVRKQFPEDAARRKSAISALRERVAAHNASQAEVKAGAINSVMDIYSKTKSLAAVQKTPEWQALGGSDRVKIEEHITNAQNAQLNRSNALLNRDNLLEQREQTALRRRGTAAYLAYSNPVTLNGMSEAQVQSLLPALGNELTTLLMEKKRGLTPKTLAAANIDNDDFNSIAGGLGLKPFSNNHDDKAAVGEVKSRVERLLDIEQQRNGKPLTREQKNLIVKNEIAKTVSVSGFWSNDTKPVITLTPNDLAKIIVPPKDKPLVEAALKAEGIAVNDTNIRRRYAMSRSTAAALVPNGR